MKQLFLFLTIFSLGFTANHLFAQNDKLTPQELKTMLAKTPKAQLVDVRTPQEVAAGSINGAVNINFNASDFDAKVNKLDKSKPVFLYCAVGGRSNAAQIKLQKMGFKKVYDLKGGYIAWKKVGF